MKQKSLFSIKDVVAIGVGAASLCRDCLCCKTLTCIEYEHSSCNMPFKLSLV